MTWMGNVSAWGALAVALLYAALAAFQLQWGLTPLVPIAVAGALVVGSFRTLRQMSGGLRLLAGAWGLAAGVAVQPMVWPPSTGTVLHDTYSVVLTSHWHGCSAFTQSSRLLVLP
jgi:hypothetical protein